MFDNLTYMHLGSSLQNSLEEYGMVCRRERSDQYYFIYKVNEKYEEGFTSESEIHEFMDGECGYSKKEIKNFLNSTAMSNYSDFMKSPLLEKVYKLSQHFGVETILGKSISPLTFSTVMDIIERE